MYSEQDAEIYLKGKSDKKPSLSLTLIGMFFMRSKELD